MLSSENALLAGDITNLLKVFEVSPIEMPALMANIAFPILLQSYINHKEDPSIFESYLKGFCTLTYDNLLEILDCITDDTDMITEANKFIKETYPEIGDEIDEEAADLKKFVEKYKSGSKYD